MISPLDTDDKHQLRLIRNVISAFLFAQTVEANLFPLGITILLDIGFGTLEDDSTFLFSSLYT